VRCFNNIPDTVETELGEATVGEVHSRSAQKEYLCPLCDSSIDVGEAHVIIVPKVIPRLRRHAHGECVEKYLEYGLDIRLHPKEPDAIRYYMFDKIKYNREL
jgi:hypothetical protein